MRLYRYPPLDRVYLAHAVPRLGKTTGLFQELSGFATVQFGGLFRGTPQDPKWGPTRRPPRRPGGTRLVIPLSGTLHAVTEESSPRRLDPNSVLVMPWGSDVEIGCASDEALFAVLETELAKGAPAKSGWFIRTPRESTNDYMNNRGVANYRLIWPNQVPCLNSLVYRVFKPGSQLRPSTSYTSGTLLISLGGRFEAVCSAGETSIPTKLGPHNRLYVPAGIAWKLRELEPAATDQSAAVLQFSLALTPPVAR